MDKITFKSITFGECKVLCLLGSISIIELENNIEKYVVAIGVDVYKGTWLIGNYFKTLEGAYRLFNNRIKD